MTAELPVGAGRSVFVIDDAPDIRLLYRLSLERHGFRVVGEADTASGAIATVAGCAPDIVLVDLVLPDGSGLDVVAAVRDVIPDARLVVCSGMDEQGTAAACRAGGADAFLHKRYASDVAVALSGLLAGDDLA